MGNLKRPWKILLHLLWMITSCSSFKSIHMGILRGQRHFLSFFFSFLGLFYSSYSRIFWRGSTVTTNSANIFSSDLDWTLILSDNYSKSQLKHLLFWVSLCQKVFINLDAPEINTETEFRFFRKIQRDRQLLAAKNLIRSIVKINSEIGKIKESTNSYDIQKSTLSLKSIFEKLGQPTKNGKFEFDLDIYLQENDLNFLVGKSEDFEIETNVFSPYLKMNLESDNQWKIRGTKKAYMTLLAMLPDATLCFTYAKEFVKIRNSFPRLKEVFLMNLVDDWMWGRSSKRLQKFEAQSEKEAMLLKHLDFLKNEFYNVKGELKNCSLSFEILGCAMSLFKQDAKREA